MHINLPFGRRGDLHCDNIGELVRYYNEIVINQEYSDVPPGPHDVVIDLGANLGMFSLWIYDRARRIYAIEASDANFRNLSQTIKTNGLNKIQAFHLAIAGKAGQRTLVRKGDCGGYNILDMREPGSSIETVDAVTLKTFLDEHKIDRVDVLKIDVEGAEREIFGSAEFKEIVPRLPFIIGEFHGGEEAAEIHDMEQLFEVAVGLRMLADHGYDVNVDRFMNSNAPLFTARLPS